MMQLKPDSSDVHAALRGLIGQRCEQVDVPHGSVLRLDIGPLGIRATDPPNTRAHGWRHLTVLSPWRLETDGAVILDWNAVAEAFEFDVKLNRLVGESVTSVTAEPPGWDLTVVWSNGWRLRVFGDSTEDRSDAWFILGTDGLELGVGPATQSRRGWELKGLN